MQSSFLCDKPVLGFLEFLKHSVALPSAQPPLVQQDLPSATSTREERDCGAKAPASAGCALRGKRPVESPRATLSPLFLLGLSEMKKTTNK